MQIDCQQGRRAGGWWQIAVLIDDLETAAAALRSAVAASRLHRARLTIISVAPRPWATVALTGMCPRRLEAEAAEHAATMVRRLAATVPADVPCTTVVCRGRAAKAIRGLLKARHYDLAFLAPRPGRALGGGISRRKAVRLMRMSSVDFVLQSSSSPISDRASLLAPEQESGLGLLGWVSADIPAN